MNNNRRVLVGAFVVLVISVTSWRISQIGYASGTGCDWGFGPAHRTVQAESIRSFFAEPLPPDFVINNFECWRWQDILVKARFTVKRKDGAALIAALEQTFLTRQDHPQVSENQKRRTLIGPPTHSTYHYYLPGVPPMDDRTVEVTLPIEPDADATVDLRTGDY